MRLVISLIVIMFALMLQASLLTTDLRFCAGFDEEENQIVTSNVAGAEIKGLEAEVVWLLGDSGTFEFCRYLDAKYTDYLVDGPGLVLLFLQS